MWPFTRAAKKPKPVATWAPAPTYIPDNGQWAALGGAMAPVSPQAAESLAAISGAVTLISSTIASLPAYVVKNDGSHDEASTHPLSRLIRDGVSESEDWSSFLELLVASALLNGNGLARIDVDSRGVLCGLRTLPWNQTVPWVAPDGTLVFDHVWTVPPFVGERKRYLRSECLFLTDRRDNGLVGVSRLRRAYGSVQKAIELQDATASFTSFAARPAGVITAPGKISKETADRLQGDWDLNYARNGKGKTAVLPEGLKFEKLGLLSAEDAALVEQLNWSIQDISRLYGVPPFLLGDPVRATFASANAALQFFAISTLTPWVARIERAFAATVLGPDVRLHLDLNALLRADPESVGKTLMSYRQAGILTPNEARADLGYPARPDGDSIAPPLQGTVGESATGPAKAPEASAELIDIRDVRRRIRARLAR